jgi:hypothetical protein
MLAAAACRHCRKLRKKRGTDQDPPTPDIKKKMGKRAWDGVVSGLQGRLQEWHGGTHASEVWFVTDCCLQGTSWAACRLQQLQDRMCGSM